MIMKHLKKLQISELIIPAAFLTLGLIFFIESFNMTTFGLVDINLVDIYPRTLSILLIAFSLFVFAQQVFRSFKNYSFEKEIKENALIQDWKKAGYRLTVFIILLIAYIFFMRTIGYFEGGFLFLTISMYYLGERNKNWLLKSIIIAAITTVVIYFIFGYLLNIYVPSGLIF